MREGGHPLTFLYPPAPRWMRAVSFGTLWLPTIPPCCSNVNARGWAPTYVSLPPCPKVDASCELWDPVAAPPQVNAVGWALGPGLSPCECEGLESNSWVSVGRLHRHPTDIPQTSHRRVCGLGALCQQTPHRRHRRVCGVCGLGGPMSTDEPPKS